MGRAGALSASAASGDMYMRFLAVSRGHSRRLTMLVAAGVLAMGLPACSSDDETAAGTPFTQALSKDYNDLAGQASALPADIFRSARKSATLS